MVKSIFTLLSTRQNNILSGASVLMVAVFASRFLGLIRDRLLVHNFNTSDAAIFFAAFKLPDLIFQLLVFGTLSVAFIPVFTELLHHKNEDEAFEFASNILNLSLLVFGLIAVIAFIFVNPLNSWIVSGFEGETKTMTDNLTRIILLPQLLLVIGTFFIGISNAYQRFIISALAPLFYNLGIILGIIFLSQPFGIVGPTIGVVLGALMHVLIQVPIVRSLGFQYKFSFNFLNDGVKEVFKLMNLRNISLVAEQISEIVSISLASIISNPSVALLTFAQHLYTVPVGLFGATIAQAAFPVLSREQSTGEKESFKSTLLTTMHQILFLTLPAAAILIVLRIPVVRLVFGASQFNWTDTVLTSKTVAFMALGLAAQSVLLLFVRSFYALKDTKTPVAVSIVTVIVNITLSAVFILLLKLDIESLGLAYAISTNLSFILLLFFLDRKVGGFDNRSLWLPGLKMLVAAMTAALALYIPIKALDQIFIDTTRTVNLLFLTGISATFGMLVYLLLVWLMEVKELDTFLNLFRRFSKLQQNLKTEEITEEGGTV